ncbi:type VI secretion system Vgr family protein [Aquitalea aquatica]|uniref:Type VI secretion system tip protein VgrG n=1 Tax=Aquitalea aquatica TaxID=3044273 RepID=A0A838Y5F3_9NEIS|nr:type VI secretion system Vgr family protein [Aquitalea magnusonii]MBA4709088.1 type VI secretion system tip protein VgrG [Aquitalea magnusonii]
MDFSALLASFAAAFSQHQRLLTLQLDGGQIAAEQLLPHTLDGSEGVSEAYRYQLTCLSPDGTIELKSLLGVAARLGVLDADGNEVVRCGVVSRAELLGSDGGFAKYGLTIEPPFALLRLRRTSRVFQDLSLPDIVKQILAEHQANNPVFAQVQTLEFHTASASPRSYCLQYRESDFDFIVRLLHEEGYAWRFEHVDGAHPQVKLVVFDDAYSLPPAASERVRFHRSDATEEEDGLIDWSAARQVVSGNVALASFDYQPVSTQHTGDQTRIQQGRGGDALQSTLQDYDPQSLYYASDADQLSHYAQLRQQAHDVQAKQFSGSGSVRSLQAGQWFRLDEHPAHEGDSSEQREFVVTGQTFRANNNLPGELTSSLRNLLANGADTTSTDSQNSSPFQTTITAQRRGIPLTPAYAHSALAKPTSKGVQTATVVGPVGEEVHTDELGRVKVQFHWQRADEHPSIGARLDDTSSCWLRVAMPSAGAGWGHQFIPRIGQEVLIDFIEGDIDRPVIVGVLYNGSHATPAFSGAGALPANKTLSGIKSKEHQGGQYNELLFDDTPGEVRAKLSSETHKTQLNLGFLTHPRSNGKAQPRGEGAELRSDASIAIRAAQGLLLTTYGKVQASGNQLDRKEMIELLDQCAELFKSVGDYASGSQALKIDPQSQTDLIESIKNWEKGSNTDPKSQGGGQSVLSLAGLGGLSYSSPKGIIGYAGLNYDLAAKKHLQFTSGEQYVLNAGNGISQFAQSGDFRLIAHQGQFLMQAQANDMVAQAEKNVRIMAVNGEVLIHAPTIRLVSAAGAFIKIDSNITLGTSGQVLIKAASKSMSGPATDSVPSPNFQSGPTDQKFQLHYPGSDGQKAQIAAHREYEVTLKDGSKLTGTSDAEGKTNILQDQAMQVAKVAILPKRSS